MIRDGSPGLPWLLGARTQCSGKQGAGPPLSEQGLLQGGQPGSPSLAQSCRPDCPVCHGAVLPTLQQPALLPVSIGPLSPGPSYTRHVPTCAHSTAPEHRVCQPCPLASTHSTPIYGCRPQSPATTTHPPANTPPLPCMGLLGPGWWYHHTPTNTHCHDMWGQSTGLCATTLLPPAHMHILPPCRTPPSREPRHHHAPISTHTATTYGAIAANTVLSQTHVLPLCTPRAPPLLHSLRKCTFM